MKKQVNSKKQTKTIEMRLNISLTTIHVSGIIC